MSENLVLDKSKRFAVRIVRLYQYLNREKKEYILSKQLLRCGTSIGANIVEANDAISKNDFINKMYIALKECSETLYWIELLYNTKYLTSTQYKSILLDCNELRRLLTAILKTAKHDG